MAEAEAAPAPRRWGLSWGSWHTGPDAPGPCPQDGRFHTLGDAASLNEKDAEFRRATFYASMRRWRESS